MASFGVGQKPFKATAPIKGSFPLDHEDECKSEMLKYMMCLQENREHNSLCRDTAKAYFQCRMEKNLMAKEEWDKLGYGEPDHVINK